MGRFNWMLQALCALSVIISTLGNGTRAIAFTGTERPVLTKDNVIISDDPDSLGTCGINMVNSNIAGDLSFIINRMVGPRFLNPFWNLGEIETYPDVLSITEADIASCLQVEEAYITDFNVQGASSTSYSDQTAMGFSFRLLTNGFALAEGFYEYYIGDTTPTLSSVGITTSNNSSFTQAEVGDIIALIFTASEQINEPIVYFQSGGKDVADSSVTYANNGLDWLALYTVDASDTSGDVTYKIVFDDLADNAGISVIEGTGSVEANIDITAPTMEITADDGVSDGDTSNDSTLSLIFTSSEATSNFEGNDITVSGGTLSNFAGSGKTYTATFTPSGVGATTIDVALSKISSR